MLASYVIQRSMESALRTFHHLGMCHVHPPPPIPIFNSIFRIPFRYRAAPPGHLRSYFKSFNHPSSNTLIASLFFPKILGNIFITARILSLLSSLSSRPWRLLPTAICNCLLLYFRPPVLVLFATQRVGRTLFRYVAAHHPQFFVLVRRRRPVSFFSIFGHPVSVLFAARQFRPTYFPNLSMAYFFNYSSFLIDATAHTFGVLFSYLVPSTIPSNLFSQP